jgi:hypothetical protein
MHFLGSFMNDIDVSGGFHVGRKGRTPTLPPFKKEKMKNEKENRESNQ